MIAIGVIGKPHGVHGELHLRIFNPEGPSMEGVSSVVLERDGRRETRALEGLRPGGQGFLVSFAGVASREEAAALTLSRVHVARADLPPLAPGEYYVADVLGCEVLAQDGTSLGFVEETFWNGAQDVMVVRPRDAVGPAAELLIPLIAEFVREVDAPARRVRVDWQA